MEKLCVSGILYLVTMTSLTICQRPNIILIVTDDQDIVLNGMTPMEKTRRLLANEGVTFSNAFCTTPVCCPSRSSILTGLYQHNHGVINNSYAGGCSGSEWQQTFEPLAFVNYIHEQGYETFYAGKYLNEYGFKKAGGVSHIPPGWDWWVGLVGNSVYYNYTLSVNGTKVRHGDKESDYLTDVITTYSLNFLRQPHIINGNNPFLMSIHPPSAHAPFTPAPKYSQYFNTTTAPRTPNFNKQGMGKHWLVRLPPEELPQESIDKIDDVYRGRWGTLLSVDDMVEAIINQLTETNLINNTYILFTSDHGFHTGQFGLPWDKRQPYETDIRIPLFIRGPNIPAKVVIPQPVLTIDLAPTLIELSGLEPPTFMDGKSFLTFINTPNEIYNRSFLIEYTGESSEERNTLEGCWGDLNLDYCLPDVSCRCQDVKNNTYSCIRQLSNDINEIYCQFQDDEHFVEMYDISKDFYQIINLAGTALDRREYYEAVLGCLTNNSNRLPHRVEDCIG